MRDIHRMREGFDLHLDNRQIVSFVIGSLIMLGVVFALGVLVGKQLAASALAAAARPVDPLAAIDAKESARTPSSVQGTGEIPTPKADALTFQKELTKPAATNPLIEPGKPVGKEKASKDVPEKNAKLAKAEAAVEPVKEAKAREPAKADRTERAEKPETSKDEPKRKEGLAAAFDKAGGKSDLGSYTLQVASLPTKADADRVVNKLAAKSISAHVIEADVPGRGHVFRVRAGTYASYAEAEEALRAFKKKSALTAIITGH